MKLNNMVVSTFIVKLKTGDIKYPVMSDIKKKFHHILCRNVKTQCNSFKFSPPPWLEQK